MVGLQKIEHVKLAVTDLEASLEFYTEVIGLTVIKEGDETVYLSTGHDANFDVALVDGGTGLEHFAVRVADEEELNRYTHRLEENGIGWTETHGTEPNQTAGVRFSLPSGVGMELVSVADRQYRHALDPSHHVPRVCPLDLDHVTLHLLDVKPNAEFLSNVLDFRLSDLRKTDQGFWRQAFLRFGDYHHDVAMFASSNRDDTLHHIAWTMGDIAHLKSFCDHLAGAGYQLEVGLGRHNAGSNLFVYCRGPGGNRHEFCAEGATLDQSTPTAYEDRTDVDAVSAWGGLTPPASFRKEGS